MVILKLPRESVKVPSVVPLIITETALTNSLLVLFLTVPDRVLLCEKELRENSSNNKAAAKRNVFFITSKLG